MSTESVATRRSPWAWVPTLYLIQGLPFAIVNSVSVIVYKSLGVSNADIAFYTAWLYLPWVIKPLWSPVVDILRTRRWWIWTMQLLMGAGFATRRDLFKAWRDIVEALCLAGNDRPVAHALKSDRGRDRGHAQQIPIQADRLDDGIQEPLLLAKSSCSTHLH